MKRTGLSLIELVVVIAIVGVLVGLLLPAVGAARERARSMQCQNRLRQLVLGLHAHHETHGVLPPGVTASSGDYPYLAWPARILPFIEQNDLWLLAERDYARQRSPFIPPTHEGLARVVEHFSCPSEGMAEQVHLARNAYVVALTDYIGVAGTDFRTRDGVLMRGSRTRMGDIRDGTSQTLCIGERPPSTDAWYGWWYAGVGQEESGVPDMLLGVNEQNVGYDVFGGCSAISHFEYGNWESVCSTLHYWSFHPTGANFAYCDGAIRILTYTTDNTVLRALSTKNKGDNLE
jgi:prepilin-type N-terminal cleavage/methylation domain-containing protein/prepilin-type processing-associated H-X9-DG protein